MEGYRQKAKQAALQRAQQLKLATAMDELVFREAFPGTDFGVGATGYTNETYLTGAAVINTWTSVYDTALVPQLGNNKIAVFYKITCEDVPNPVSAVRFRLGATGATALGWFQIEQFVNVKLTPEVYLSEPIVYNPSQWLFIEFYPMVAVPAAGYRLGFGCFIAEPVGEQLS
jgi:hypothetical protein